MAKSREKTRFYAKGGHVHSMEKSQHDMKIPRRGKTPKLSVQNFEEAERMRHGGRARHRAEGGQMAEGGAMADGGAMSAMKRGGKSKKHHYADGGAVPTLLPQMQDAMMQAAMNSRSDMKRGGKARHHYAEGGKVRDEVDGIEVEVKPMRKGGHMHKKSHRKAEGGKMMEGGRMAEGGKMAEGGSYRRGGHSHKKHHKAGGGMVDAIQADAARRQADAASGIPQIGVYNPQMPRMKRGGRTRHRAEGGQMADGGAMSAMKKGGRSHKYAAGGAVRNHYGRYEADMMGEHHGASNHYRDYVADMMGEHGCHEPVSHPHIGRSKGTPFAEGGYAMGGVGKYRHGEATKSGKQIGHAKAKGSPFA
jgi:hypothetical protein